MSDFFLDYENGNDANTGADWANAWKTITLGATAARIAPGDRVKIAKSPDPVSIGTATWTDLDKTVTRTGAAPAGSETLLVDDCESGWVADNSSTVTHPTTTHKSGSANVQITKSSYATATLYAHKTLAAPIDCSGFEALTGWVRVDAAVADASRWVVCLCSDADGLVIVDSFAVDAMPASVVSANIPFRWTRVGGGACGASIASIAIYSGASAPSNGQDIFFDNLNVCNSFSILSLISKNSGGIDGAEPFFGMQSINGTTLKLDNDPAAIASVGRGYTGTTEEVATYRRECFMTTPGITGNQINDSGTNGAPITFSGGWNTSSGLQDGDTFFDGRAGNGNGITFISQSFVDIERLSFARYQNGVSVSGAMNAVRRCCASNNRTSGLSDSSYGLSGSQIFAVNNGSHGVAVGVRCGLDIESASGNLAAGVSIAGVDARFSAGMAANNATYGVSQASGISGAVVSAAVVRDNATAQVTNNTGSMSMRDCTLAGTEFAGAVAYADGRIYSHNHGLSGYDHIFTDGGAIYSEATDFDAPATGKRWTLLTSATTRTSSYPLKLRLPGIAVVANKLVTIKAQMRKAHATNVVGKLVMPGGQIAGVAADVVATLASATAEEELTITFTPTAAGVVVPEVWAEYVAGHAAVCIDRLTSVTQAA